MDIESITEALNLIKWLSGENPELQNQFDLIDSTIRTLAIQNAYLSGYINGTTEALEQV